MPKIVLRSSLRNKQRISNMNKFRNPQTFIENSSDEDEILMPTRTRRNKRQVIQDEEDEDEKNSVKSRSYIDVANDGLRQLGDYNFISVKHNNERYIVALEIAKEYFLAISDKDTNVPGKFFYLHEKDVTDFLVYFIPKFYSALEIRQMEMETKPEIIGHNRPEILKDTDIELNDSFYKKIGINYASMTENMQRNFEEEKDVVHEEIYGHITRFDNLPVRCLHGYITTEKASKARFVKELLDIYEYVKTPMEIPRKRHMRQHVTYLQ